MTMSRRVSCSLVRTSFRSFDSCRKRGFPNFTLCIAAALSGLRTCLACFLALFFVLQILGVQMFMGGYVGSRTFCSSRHPALDGLVYRLYIVFLLVATYIV